MKKNGFTLVELLAVVILIAALLAFTYPKIIDIAEKQNAKLDDAKVEIIKTAVNDYMNTNINNYTQNIGDVHCISIETLENENLIPIDISDVTENYSYVRVTIGANNKNSYVFKKECSTQ